MKHLFKGKLFIPGLLIFLFSCHSSHKNNESDLAPGVHRVEAREVIQASRYTYVRVRSDDRDYWIAVNKMKVNAGGTYYWSQGVPMKDFPSKELNKTFDLIYLVQDFTDQPILAGDDMPSSSWTGSTKTSPEKKDVTVKPVGEGITIKELYDNTARYEGKSVTIRGEVVKYNPSIMNRNWIHIQDGTESANHFDLAVTSQDPVKVGDIVSFKGVIALNKDFGAGYVYDVIMEDASLVETDN